MKSLRYFLVGTALVATALILAALQIRPAVADERITPPSTRSGIFLGEEFQLSDDDWVEDFPEESKEGSPVRPGKVAICHKGMTIYVTQNAVPNHLAHGDKLGPCSASDTTYTIVCHEGKSLVVTLVEAAGHLKHGDSLGVCGGGGGIIMCSGKENVAVPQAEVEARLKQNWTPGPCNGKEAVVMCHEGKTIVVLKENVEGRLKAGDTLGACPKK